MKYHNFFEKKEIEYRNKIKQKFRNKKIQNLIKKENNKNIFNSDDTNDENDNNNDKNNEDYRANIIKIILWFELFSGNLGNIKEYF